MTMKRLLIIVWAVLCCGAVTITARSSWAATYYVDNCVVVGTDINNGTSTSTPWLTVNKVNTSTFSAGDSVLFQRTCTWREQLTVPSSGSTGNPITFGAYGTGPAPIISGADLLTSWTTEGSLYYSSASTQPTQVFVDGQRFTAVSAKSSLVTGTWWWDSANGRVWAYDNPSGHTIEAGQRKFAIYTNSKTYLNIKNLTLGWTNSVGLYLIGSSGSTVTSVTIGWNASNGILGRYIAGAVLSQVDSQYNDNYGISFDTEDSNITFLNCTASYNGQDGFHLSELTGALISGGNSHHNGNATVQGAGASVDQPVDVVSSSNITVTGFAAYNNTGNGFVSVSANAGQDGNSVIIVEHSSFYNNGGGPEPAAGIRFDFKTHASVARYNEMYGNDSAGIVAEEGAYDNEIYYNLSYSNARGISHSNSSGTGNIYYNNVLYANTQDGFQVFSSTNLATIKNNIFYGNGRYGYNTDGRGSHVVDYNLVYGNASSNYNGITKPTHDINADPLFINASGNNFTLQNGSPAINAGTNLGTNYQNGLDPRSSVPWATVNQNSQGSGWEILPSPVEWSSWELRGVAVTAEGVVLVGGAITNFSAGPEDQYVAALAARGLDGTWSAIGLPEAGALDRVNDILIASDGRIFLACGLESIHLLVSSGGIPCGSSLVRKRSQFSKGRCSQNDSGPHSAWRTQHETSTRAATRSGWSTA